MAKINPANGRQVIDYMARDYRSFKQAMIDLIPEKLPNWTDRSEADFGIVLIELFAYMADILSYYQDRIANESFLATAQERRSVIQHLRLIGYDLKTASAASAMLTLTFTVDNDQTGTVAINQGDQFSTKSTKDQSAVLFEYVDLLPLVIDLSNLEDGSGGPGKKKFQSGLPLKDQTTAPFIPVVQGQMIKSEILGSSDGSRNQIFQLAQSKLLPNSLEVKVNIGGQEPTWLRRENLVYSDSSDEHYFIRIDENDNTKIYFGDGTHGKIPEKDAQISATYRVGGGVHGNVGAKQITEISNAPQLPPRSAKIWNEKSATGGAERESIEHAIEFAPTVFRSLKRCVTAEDYVALAERFPGVAKAKAEASSWNYIDLYVAPGGGDVATDILKADLLTYFEDLRMMTALIRIKDPTYVPIFVTAFVNVSSYYLQDDIQHKIENSIQSDLLNFDKLDFGQYVYLSKVYEAIENIEGVHDVNISEFLRDQPAAIWRPGDPDYDMNDAIAQQGIIKIEKYEIPAKGHPNYIRTIMTGGH